MTKSNIVLFIVCIILLVILFVTSTIDCNKPVIPEIVEVPYPVPKPYPIPAETLYIKGDTIFVDTSKAINDLDSIPDSSNIFVSEFDRTYKDNNDSVRVQSNVAFNTENKVMTVFDELLTWYKAERPAKDSVYNMVPIEASFIESFWVKLFIFLVAVIGWAI